MYIIHFKRYKNNELVDAWTSEDYFRTYSQAENWLERSELGLKNTGYLKNTKQKLLTEYEKAITDGIIKAVIYELIEFSE